MLVFNRDKAELEAEFRNPGIPETGLSVEELKAGLLRLAERKKDGSRAVVKAEAFSYLLDNMRIGVSARDLFVTLGVWGRKPFDDAILPGWKQELFDGALREAAARARTLADNGTVAFHFDFWHSVPDWDAILSLGFSGLLSRAEAAEKRFMERAGNTMTAENRDLSMPEPLKISFQPPKPEPRQPLQADIQPVPAAKPYDEMTVEELQGAILAKLAANGPLTDRMRREVAENVYRDSLLNWVRSFR